VVGRWRLKEDYLSLRGNERIYRYEGMSGRGKSCGSFLDKRRKPPVEDVFPRDPMNIIANVAVKKDPGGPDNLNLFPLSMEIDYIRYYQKK